MLGTTRSGSLVGLGFALVSALAFGASGAFMKPVLESGWSPGAAVLARVLVAAAVLLVPTLLLLRGRYGLLWQARWRVLAFGAIAVAGTQLAYFAAIERIPVSMALLIEYLAPVLLVLLAWVRTRRVPRAVVLAGTVLSLVGLALVIGPGDVGGVDLLGVGYGLLAAVGLAAYFLLAAVPEEVPPIAMAGAGLLVGAIVLGVLGLLGAVPMRAQLGDVPLLEASVPWYVPIVVVGVVATAFAYATGIAATVRLGSRVASFVGLLEVVFAALLAWVLLGEALGPLQLLGGALIVIGIGLVRSERQARAPADETQLAEAIPAA